MAKMKKIALLSALLIIALLSAPSCAKTVPQQEYDRLNSELATAQSQLASAQSKLAEAETFKTKYEELNAKYEELNKQNDAAKDETEAMKAQYEQLNKEHEALNAQYEAIKGELEATKARYEQLSAEYDELTNQIENLTAQPAEATAAGVEQALFQLINQERTKKGLAELMLGKDLYKWATGNSHDMAINKKLQYSDYPSFQQIFWATGYKTAESISTAALTIWKNQEQYDKIFLNAATPYGAVAAYKSGEIFYITFIADYFD